MDRVDGMDGMDEIVVEGRRSAGSRCSKPEGVGNFAAGGTLMKIARLGLR